MAFGTASRIFSAFITEALNNNVAYDLGADTLKAALFNDTTTPNQDAAAASIIYTAGVWTTGNEVQNGGWAAGGIALTSVTSASATGTYTLDAADTPNPTAATLANVYGCLLYDDTSADAGISYHSFGGSAQGVTSGTFTIVWNSSGILTLDLTP